MIFSPFSFILICAYLLIIVKFKTVEQKFRASLVLTLFCSIVLYMGYFVSFSKNNTIPFSTITWVMSFVFAFVLNQKSIKAHNSRFYKNYKDISKYGKIFILFILITTLFFYLFRYDKLVIDGSQYEEYIRDMVGMQYLTSSSLKKGYIYIAIMYCYVIYTACRHLSISDFIWVAERFIKLSFISVIVGYAEFILENAYGSLSVTQATIAIFGKSGAHQVSLIERYGWYAIQGLTKEASMFSTAVFYTSIISANLILLVKHNIKYIVFCLLSFILLLINRSMSSYVYLFIGIMFVIYLNLFNLKFLRNRRNVKKILVAICFVFILIITNQSFNYTSNYLMLRLNESIKEVTNISDGLFSATSEGIRYLGIYHCLTILWDRPFLGIGLGTVTCVSGIVTMLCNIGVIGFASFIVLQMKLIKGSNAERLFIILLILVFPNILLNDLNTMLSLSIPFTLILTSYSLKVYSEQLVNKRRC